MILRIGKGEKSESKIESFDFTSFLKNEKASVRGKEMAHHIIEYACICGHQVHAFGQRLQDRFTDMEITF
jgi:hypothetical protein